VVALVAAREGSFSRGESLVVKYGEKIVPTRAPSEHDLDKNFRRLSRSPLIKGAGINGGRFSPSFLPSRRPIDPFNHSSFFPVRHGSLSMCCSASSGSPGTQQAHRCRRVVVVVVGGRSASRTLATSSAVAVAREQHPLILPRAREIKLFTFARRVIERERTLEKSPTVVDASML